MPVKIGPTRGGAVRNGSDRGAQQHVGDKRGPLGNAVAFRVALAGRIGVVNARDQFGHAVTHGR